VNATESGEHLNNRTVKAVVGLIVILLVVYFVFFRSQPLGPMGEVVSPNEDTLTAQIVASAIRMVDQSHAVMVAKPVPGNPPGMPEGRLSDHQPYRRDVHAKTYGCLQAKFKVLPNLDLIYRYGIFAEPKEYEAWVRYSSGNTHVQDDREKDARGMAIKVMGVPGRKLLEDDGVPHAETQDFVLMNATQFFILNLPEYLSFTNYLGQGSNYGYFLGGFTPDLPQKNWSKLFNFKGYHWNEMRLALKTLKAPPDSLLNTDFYSVSAYTLGSQQYVKYAAKPCGTAGRSAAVDSNDPNFLRQEMVERLKNGTACFEFMVQRQVAGKNMPVEDNTVEWSESDSPFVPVARIEIPQQSFVGNQTVCENLTFNPWYSLPEHRPVGVMNRVRKPLYLEVSRYRRTMNGQSPLCEPKNFKEEDANSCEKQQNALDLSDAAVPATIRP
jgi:hypothetical protein